MTESKRQSEPTRLRGIAEDYGKRKTNEDLVQTAKIVGALATVLVAGALLAGCAGYQGQLEPNGYHSIKKICYHDKKGGGTICAVQDCLTHYESVEKGAAGAE